jgi:glycosyltransferase involved in cell wall biosynthesis
MNALAVGVHAHAEPQRLCAIRAALEAHTSPGCELVLLPDSPDPATRAALAEFADIPQSGTDTPLGPAACLNRLAREIKADTLVLLESGMIVSPGWLDKLLAALEADPRHGLGSPSTNRAWNRLAAFPNANGDAASITRTADAAEARYGQSWQSLAPLWDIGDFCLTVKRSVIDAISPADEGYGLGPCWEMDYAVRAVRAGFIAVWAQSAYAFRHPFTARRQLEEGRLFESSRRRYQDKFCGLRLSVRKSSYARHCHGEACVHFAPPAIASATLAAAPADCPTKPLSAMAGAMTPAPSSPTVDTAARATSPAQRSAPATPRSGSGAVPLVSCIMPTSARPEWVPQAVRRHRVPTRCPIGKMRNIGCDLVKGEIVIHWDDDDWYAPNRISAQVQPIVDGVADLTGLYNTCFFELDTWRFWRCTPALHARLFVRDVHRGTLAFRRSLYGPNCRHPDLSLAEDAWFLQRAVAAGARVERIPGADLFIYLRHAGNAWAFTCGRYLDPKGWVEVPEPDTMVLDRPFYVPRSPAMAAAGLAAMPAIVSPPPFVSCIMPTANRRQFVPAAIEGFLAQDYPAAELIIVDDGRDPIGDLVLAHPAVRYVASSPFRNLGAKRNAACKLARGDIILHWDDDDWYAPHRIRAQVEQLGTSGAGLCGIDTVLFFDPRVPAAWEYTYPSGGPPWVHGATMCYRRDYWRAHPFQDVDIGEDNLFAGAAAPGELCVMSDHGFFVGLVHAGNTSVKQVKDPRWRACDVATVRELTGPAWPRQ